MRHGKPAKGPDRKSTIASLATENLFKLSDSAGTFSPTWHVWPRLCTQFRSEGGIICGVLVLGLVIHIAGRSVQQLNFVPKCLRRYIFTFDRFHMKSRCRVKHQAPKKRKQESANWSPQGDMQLCRLSGSIKVWNLIHFTLNFAESAHFRLGIRDIRTGQRSLSVRNGRWQSGRVGNARTGCVPFFASNHQPDAAQGPILCLDGVTWPPNHQSNHMFNISRHGNHNFVEINWNQVQFIEFKSKLRQKNLPTKWPSTPSTDNGRD